MRLEKYIKEEDIVQKALALDEPEVGGDYNEDYVNKRVDIITTALESIKGDDEASEAIIRDLKDKLEKWENVEKYSKPKKSAPPPEKKEEEVPEE
jgi:3-hydroxyacyl-CoA dehydrogenase